MKHLNCLYLFLSLAVALSGCISSEAIITPTRTQIQPPSPTSIPPTYTLTPYPTQAATLTQPATLEPEQAKEAIGKLLREPMDCLAPCFWEIVPGQTMLGDAQEILTHLGLKINSTTQENKEFYGTSYNFDNGLSIRVILTIQDTVVKNIRIKITPETHQLGASRKWLAYSPEILINRYGSPSRVDFFVGRGTPSVSYAMVMYFDAVDLIVEYSGYDIETRTTSFRVCPLTNQFDSVRIWLGENPENPPGDAMPLENASLITLEEFSKLMTGNSDEVCIYLKEEIFP